MLKFGKGSFCICCHDHLIFHSFCLCAVLFLLICISWTMAVSLEWNQLDHVACMCGCIQFARILLRIMVSMLIKEIGLYFCFLIHFWHQVNIGFVAEFYPFHFMEQFLLFSFYEIVKEHFFLLFFMEAFLPFPFYGINWGALELVLL
jgi:hypothetical protein